MINDKNLSRNLPVVKNDNLIYARYSTTTTGMKIIYIAASKITKEDTALKEFTFNVKEFCEILEIKSTGKYDKLKMACRELIKSFVTVETEKGWKVFPWFHHIEYLENEGVFKVQFHEYLEPYLLYVRDNIYTKLSLHSVLSFRSQYAMRFYEICSQTLKFKSSSEKVVEINELRLMFGVEPTEYPMYANFKQKVILQAQKEINIKSDVYFDFKEEKEGRKITKIRFFIRRNKNTNNQESFIIAQQGRLAMPKEELAQELQDLILERYELELELNYITDYDKYVIQSTIDGIREKQFSNLKNESKAIIFFKSVLRNKQIKYDEQNSLASDG